MSELEPAYPRQDADGTPFLAYYDRGESLSFVWDGHSDHIEVSWGGAGKPVVATIPAPPMTDLGMFQEACDRYVNRPRTDQD